MNQVDPDFIRLRTLAIPDHLVLAEDVAQGTFEKAAISRPPRRSCCSSRASRGSRARW